MTTYSNLAKQILSQYLLPGSSAGVLLLERMREPAFLESIRCLNCNDAKEAIIQVCYPSVEVSPSNPSAAYAVDPSGNLHRVKETLHFACPICNDREIYFEYLAGDSGVEEHQQGWRIDYFQNERGKESAYQACILMLADVPRPSGLVLFHGDYGVGKSGLLKSTVNQMVRAGISARYIRAADILTDLRSTFDTKGVNETDILERYCSYTFLAIDEVDVIGDSAWAEGALRTLIDRRYERRMIAATLLATNKPPDQLWPYLASRCQDGIRVLVSGRDLRNTAVPAASSRQSEIWVGEL